MSSGVSGQVLRVVAKAPVVKRLLERISSLEDRVDRLEAQHPEVNGEGMRARIRELEDEVEECRRLNKRVAEVTDIVAEVLLPADQRDEESLKRRLDAYAETL